MRLELGDWRRHGTHVAGVGDLDVRQVQRGSTYGSAKLVSPTSRRLRSFSKAGLGGAITQLAAGSHKVRESQYRMQNDMASPSARCWWIIVLPARHWLTT